MSAANNPLNQKLEPVSWNFNLLSQNNLGGFGGMGEGIAIQLAKDGRRIAWLAHESAPKNFTGVDVSDPRNPKVIVQTELPNMQMRSNSLDLSGDILAVAYQTQKTGMKPAGLELFDVSVPEEPRSISFFDCSGPHSRGVHQLWFCDGEYVHMAAGAPDFNPSHPNDDQFYRRRKSAAGGCRALRRPTTSRRRRAIRSTRGIARTTPMSTRSDRTGFIFATSTAACS